ncbi:hypothetical protein CBR_g3265 [Chara braunii]|uniref:Uncharacterized protein n=1 Tax=Chara braunii TaxID=69332 RepID=A0A388KFJ2_CHABU|nr:hypothetical protein CBR_g3265 [Chara braunii]|eukprot:GBG68723.1 hypothetical protein CBR_g3265 [Chara braunii]
MDALQHTRGRMLAGELTVTCTEGDVMGCGEGETKKGREEPDRPIGVCSGNGATLGKDAPAPHVLFACSDVAALKSHHVRHNFPCVLASKAPSAREEVERQSICIMSMSVAQVAKALAEVMKYVEERFHYNGRGELSLVQERVPRYFAVTVDMRSAIMANGSGCVQARTLLERLRESPDIRVDSDAEDSPYSLKGVVQWMCSEGMRNEGLVDMSMQQRGGTYTPVAFRKFMVSVAKGWDMLVEGTKDELKRGAAEILVLSRIKDMTQTPPQDFQELPIIIADGVKYVLLDQLCDLMGRSEDDRNVIHEMLHEVTEYAVQGRDVIEFEPASAGEEIISGRPLWGGLLGCALERLGLATCDVERQREREEGWRMIASETRLPVIEETGETSAEDEHTDDAQHKVDAEEEDKEECEGSDVDVSGSDVSSDEADNDNDVYYDLKTAGGQVTKGWAHAILRLARVFPDPHNVLRVVFNGATPDGAMQYAAVTTIMRSCKKGKKWSRIGKAWFVLVNREAVLATSLTRGLNLSCLLHGAVATAWGETLHPGLSTGDAVEMDSGPLVCDCGRPFMSLRTLNSHRARACPAVVEEGAQRQENNAAHDPGPSDMGAANLAADDSDDAGARDNANGAAGDNAESEA